MCDRPTLRRLAPNHKAGDRAGVRISSRLAFVIAPDGQVTIYVTKDWRSPKASNRGTGVSPNSTSPMKVGTVSVLFPRVNQHPALCLAHSRCSENNPEMFTASSGGWSPLGGAGRDLR